MRDETPLEGLFLSLDVGTSGVKASLFTADGVCRGERSAFLTKYRSCAIVWRERSANLPPYGSRSNFNTLSAVARRNFLSVAVMFSPICTTTVRARIEHNDLMFAVMLKVESQYE